MIIVSVKIAIQNTPLTSADAIAELYEAGVPIVTANSYQDTKWLHLYWVILSSSWNQNNVAPWYS